MTAADEELHPIPQPKKTFTTLGTPEALTLEQYRALTDGMDRNPFDEPIQKRRGTANRQQITATTFGDFI